MISNRSKSSWNKQNDLKMIKLPSLPFTLYFELSRTQKMNLSIIFSFLFGFLFFFFFFFFFFFWGNKHKILRERIKWFFFSPKQLGGDTHGVWRERERKKKLLWIFFPNFLEFIYSIFWEFFNFQNGRKKTETNGTN